jgi:hypothetical protein
MWVWLIVCASPPLFLGVLFAGAQPSVLSLVRGISGRAGGDDAWSVHLRDHPRNRGNATASATAVWLEQRFLNREWVAWRAGIGRGLRRAHSDWAAADQLANLRAMRHAHRLLNFPPVIYTLAVPLQCRLVLAE